MKIPGAAEMILKGEKRKKDALCRAKEYVREVSDAIRILDDLELRSIAPPIDFDVRIHTKATLTVKGLEITCIFDNADCGSRPVWADIQEAQKE